MKKLLLTFFITLPALAWAQLPADNHVRQSDPTVLSNPSQRSIGTDNTTRYEINKTVIPGTINRTPEDQTGSLNDTYNSDLNTEVVPVPDTTRLRTLDQNGQPMNPTQSTDPPIDRVEPATSAPLPAETDSLPISR